MSQFKNQKFKVANATISTLLQEELFKQGYTWSLAGQKVSHTGCRFLYTYEDGHIRNGTEEDHYNRHKNTEVRVVTENKLVIAELQPVRDKVVVFGKTYYKDDVDAALALLPKAVV